MKKVNSKLSQVFLFDFLHIASVFMNSQTRSAYCRPSPLKLSRLLAGIADGERTIFTVPNEELWTLMADVAALAAEASGKGNVVACRHGEGIKGLTDLLCFVGVRKR